jgi:hypothetical protein
MPIDFTLTPDQQRLRADARARSPAMSLSKVESATQDLPTPLARFAATKPFYEQTVAAGFLRGLIPAPLGGQGTGVMDMAILAGRKACTHPGASGRRSLGNFRRKEVGLPRHRLGRERGRPTDGGLPHRSRCTAGEGDFGYRRQRPAGGHRTRTRS